MPEFGEVQRNLHTHGVAIARSVLDQHQLRVLLAAVQPDTAPRSVRHRSGHTYGVRGLLDTRPELAAHFRDIGLTRFASEALGPPTLPIDAIFFDKHQDANWTVPGHQDVVVPVPPDSDNALVRRPRRRGNLTYGEPPDHVLDELIAVRVHFDDSREDAGPLCVVPGTHLRGRIPEADISALPDSVYEPCTAEAGDLLLIKPLLVHRSAKSTSHAHRRVLHILFAPLDGWHARLLNDAAQLGVERRRNPRFARDSAG